MRPSASNPTAALPEEPVDVIIAGSGAAGSAMAAMLAEGGKRVLILEAGPEVKPERMVSSTLFARRLKCTGTPVIEEGKNPVGYVFNAGRGVGGSAEGFFAENGRNLMLSVTVARCAAEAENDDIGPVLAHDPHHVAHRVLVVLVVGVVLLRPAHRLL